MKCSITSVNVKILSRALHSLAKIGDELHVDLQKEGLSFRTVNASKSAYAEFIFSPNFFTSYKFSTDGMDNGESSHCKIAMRSCLAVFRAGTDKSTDSCALRLDAAGNHLVIELRCRNGRRETHHLPVIETDGFVAVFARDNSPNQLVAEAKVWVDAMHNFQTAQDEVTLTVGRDRVTLSSHIDQIPDPNKVVRTELCLRSGEFETFDVTEEAAITFKLKDLRSMLAFGDGVSLPIAMHFDSRGKPVVFLIEKNTFGATFVLATLSLPSDTQTTATQGSALVVTTPIVTKRPGTVLSDDASQPSKRPSIDVTNKASERRHLPNESKRLPSENRTLTNEDKTLTNESSYLPNEIRKLTNGSRHVTNESRHLPNENRTLTNEDMTLTNENSHLPNESRHLTNGSRHVTNESIAAHSKLPQSSQGQNGEKSSISVLRNRNTTQLDPSPFAFVNRDPSSKGSDPIAESDDFLSDLNFDPYDPPCENPGELIPGTPPPVLSERVRTIFQRCFEPSFDVRLLPGYNCVLAEDLSDGSSQ